MNQSFDRQAGIALIIFCILLVCTIVLHPAGGSIQHLINMTTLIVITHSIAICSLPLGWVGFWGLTRKIGMDHFWSVLAFAMVSLGLVAALCAAATNGLVLPIYLQHYAEAPTETPNVIDPVLRYSFAVNHAFDYIYTGAFCLAILCWSIAILTTRKLATWLGWFGIALPLLIIVLLISGMAVNSVHGLRIFVTAIIVWILLIGVSLSKQTPSPS